MSTPDLGDSEIMKVLKKKEMKDLEMEEIEIVLGLGSCDGSGSLVVFH